MKKMNLLMSLIMITGLSACGGSGGARGKPNVASPSETTSEIKGETKGDPKNNPKSAPTPVPTPTPVPLVEVRTLEAATSLGKTKFTVYTGDFDTSVPMTQIGELTYATLETKFDTTHGAPTETDTSALSEEHFPVYLMQDEGELSLVSSVSKTAAEKINHPILHQETISTGWDPVSYCDLYRWDRRIPNATYLDQKNQAFNVFRDLEEADVPCAGSNETHTVVCQIPLNYGRAHLPIEETLMATQPTALPCVGQRKNFNRMSAIVIPKTWIEKVSVLIGADQHQIAVEDLNRLPNGKARAPKLIQITEDVLDFKL